MVHSVVRTVEVECVQHKDACCSVKNSSNGINFTKKRAKNGHFFSQKTGIKRAKLQNFNPKNGRFKKKFKTYSLKYF